ncbi:MAG: hypothetical protein HKN09_12185, partial [Saprospiraceae bacterium]|nr:hypothetical protein [Saprospiraceae bacterium]
MKKRLFICMTLCAFLSTTNLSGQKIGGILVDEDDKTIDNEEIELMVFVCKNGDSLFTKNDTLVTKDYGVFSTDLTDDFKSHPVGSKDTISYQLIYTYRGEEIMTEKKVWSNVRFASQASVADHATTSDVSATTLSYPSIAIHTDKDGLVIISEEGNPAPFKRADINYNGQGLYTFELGEDPSLAVIRNMELEAITNAINSIPPDGQNHILTLNNSGSEVNFQTQHHWASDVMASQDLFYNVTRDPAGNIVLNEDHLTNTLINAPELPNGWTWGINKDINGRPVLQ